MKEILLYVLEFYAMVLFREKAVIIFQKGIQRSIFPCLFLTGRKSMGFKVPDRFIPVFVYRGIVFEMIFESDIGG
jgi:hypothetical protein